MYQLAKVSAAPSTSAESPAAARANRRRQIAILALAQSTAKAAFGNPDCPEETGGSQPCANALMTRDASRGRGAAAMAQRSPPLGTRAKFARNRPREYSDGAFLFKPRLRGGPGDLAGYAGSTSQIAARSG